MIITIFPEKKQNGNNRRPDPEAEVEKLLQAVTDWDAYADLFEEVDPDTLEEMIDCGFLEENLMRYVSVNAVHPLTDPNAATKSRTAYEVEVLLDAEALMQDFAGYQADMAEYRANRD